MLLNVKLFIWLIFRYVSKSYNDYISEKKNVKIIVPTFNDIFFIMSFFLIFYNLKNFLPIFGWSLFIVIFFY